MATCIRCEEDLALGSQARCSRAPDGGCHEFLPHPFKGGRHDGRCAEIDLDYGTTCGHTETPTFDPSSVVHW